MEEFLKEALEVNDLTELNICRLFLKATCILDISTEDGKSIRVTAWNGTKNTTSTRYEWQTQSKPNQKIWGIWHAALHSTYRLIINLTLSKQMQLGPWLHPGSTGWVYSPSQDRIWEKCTRVDSLYPTPTKKRQNESSALHQNRGKIYSLAPQLTH